MKMNFLDAGPLIG